MADGNPTQAALQYQRVSYPLCDVHCFLLVQNPAYTLIHNPLHINLDPKLRKLNQLQKSNHIMNSTAKQ